MTVWGTSENEPVISARKQLTFQKVEQAANGLPADQFCACRSERCLPAGYHTGRDYGLSKGALAFSEAAQAISCQQISTFTYMEFIAYRRKLNNQLAESPDFTCLTG